MRWQIRPSMSGWWAHPANSCGLMDPDAEHFRSLPEAHTYAMRMSRTITVELPKVGDKCIDPDMSPAMFVEKIPSGVGIYLGHRFMLGLTASELKPLGEYLLALHYAIERS